jgi:Ca2+-binding EF-hand superfamily protein
MKRTKSAACRVGVINIPATAFRMLALAAALATGCSTNKTLEPNSPASAFDRADANHDGKLSLDELNEFVVNEIFDSRDANHDGKMTKDEWTGGDPGRLAQFNKRDANGDGIVTKEEALAYGRNYGTAKKMMKEADKNHDGSLDRNEVQAYYGSREGPPD